MVKMMYWKSRVYMLSLLLGTSGPGSTTLWLLTARGQNSALNQLLSRYVIRENI